MKSILRILFLIGCFNRLEAQITTPIIKANFGVDADLNANYFNNLVQTGNDDWFNNSATDTIGKGVIDTTGAAALVAQYGSNPGSRNIPFSRSMAYPPYTIENNHMLIDAVFIRDYHGSDSTIFASGASKNGMSPQYWSCPVAQSVPDKNEILDMMVHVRRAGPTITDSLWMFGGISIENTTGDRYFDFEMYQTDIYYDRSTLAFYGYGPDAGHTSWKFDASGNVTAPGDIIFSADYGSSSLSYIEARIWVDSSALSITPAGFSWTGSFDGTSAGSKYGYAGISPKSSGAFYSGTENSTSTWAGPFQLVRSDNSIVTSYITGQYMEFGVNLTKLGLDPATIGGNACGMPFRRILVKSRASTSFTAALKDFVAPFDFFVAPKAQLTADTTALCGMAGPTVVKVINPVSTSVYTWYTPDGHIASYNGDTSITADSAGTYIVTQQLQGGCSVYASDTVVLTPNSSCFVLKNLLHDFTGNFSNNRTFFYWSVGNNPLINYFEIQQSTDGIHFNTLGMVNANSNDADIVNYNAAYTLNGYNNGFIYYRLKIYGFLGQSSYSKVIKMFYGNGSFISITPNPVSDVMNINISTSFNEKILLEIYDPSGRLMKKMYTGVEKGNNILTISDFRSWPVGIYSVKITLDKNVFINKMVLKK